MDLQGSINNRAAGDAGEYDDILAYIGQRFGEDEKQAAERLEIVAGLVGEKPEAAGASAEFLGITPRQINVVLSVLGVVKPAWMADVIADEVRRFDEAGEGIRAAVMATGTQANHARALNAINAASAAAPGGTQQQRPAAPPSRPQQPPAKPPQSPRF